MSLSPVSSIYTHNAWGNARHLIWNCLVNRENETRHLHETCSQEELKASHEVTLDFATQICAQIHIGLCRERRANLHVLYSLDTDKPKTPTKKHKP